MKQEPEAIRKIIDFTRGTLKNLKVELTKSCQKLDCSVYAVMFCQCMDSLETVITSIVSQFGVEYYKITKDVASIDATLTALKQENKLVQENLQDALKVVVQKQAKIQELQITNNTLVQEVLNLQQIVQTAGNELSENSQSNSLDNVDLQNLEVYVSDDSSQGSDIQQLLQLEEGA